MMLASHYQTTQSRNKHPGGEGGLLSKISQQFSSALSTKSRIAMREQTQSSFYQVAPGTGNSNGIDRKDIRKSLDQLKEVRGDIHVINSEENFSNAAHKVLQSETFNPSFFRPRDITLEQTGYATESNAYLKYMEAERRVSRRERVLRNLDKHFRHVSNPSINEARTSPSHIEKTENPRKTVYSGVQKPKSVLGLPESVAKQMKQWKMMNPIKHGGITS